MVRIETIDLTTRQVTLPSDRVGMVIAQPFVSLTTVEPFRCVGSTRPQQLDMLRATLAVARAAHHCAVKTHFTVFPEYSVPGTEGIGIVEAALRASDWPTGTIVIGGTDALTRSQYLDLLGEDGTHVDSERNGGARVGSGEWVNCAITWVKGGDGRVERWIQPKLHPAREEMNVTSQHMFRGESVYVFKGRLSNDAPYRFATLICFDWIATVGAQKPYRWILGDVHEQAGQAQLPLSWLFVIQRNPKPSHDTFLSEVAPFFNQTEFPNALRDRACLVFANNAGRATPGRTDSYGTCSIVFSHQAGFDEPTCAPTVSNGGRRFRDGSTLLAYNRDIVFRERGACIHSFAQINPGSLIAGPAGRTFAVEHAHECPISPAPDPRAPDGPVPASVKWINDELDALPRLSATYFTAPLCPQSDAQHDVLVVAIRRLSAQDTAHAVGLATQGSSARHADEWDGPESRAVEHLVHTLEIIGIAFASTTVGAAPAHASITMRGQLVDLLAIRGATHEGCIEHSKDFVSNPQRQVLLISRDRDNTAWHKRFGSFLEPTTPKLGEERRITDPASGSLHLGYERLLELFRQSQTTDAIREGISAEFAA